MRKQTGFTLIELVMVIVIIGIISTIIGRVLLQYYQIFTTAQNVAETDWQGFMTLTRLENDIHTIRSPADISTIQASQLAFTNVSGSSITYQLSGSSLLRNGQTVASGIQSLTFTYLTASGATTSTPAAVRYITITANTVQGNMTSTFITLAGVRSLS